MSAAPPPPGAPEPQPAADAPTLPPRPQDTATQPPGVPAPPAPGDVPEHIGRYRVERLLGQGGMGAVYLAHDPQLDRPVALKVPRGGPAADRFLREARAAAAVRHPNICPIYDLGEANGVRYLCLAYVRGEPLSRRVGPGRPLPVAEAVALVRTVARAMHEAHRHGVIHRDLKPANILIDESGQPVVMDFGLARPLTPLATQLTATGDVMGTPAYMPPEQIEGDVLRMGPACDIYSLGVILYELLTGTVPFHGDLIALATQVVADPPPPPSRHRPDLDQRLDNIVLKALAKHPDDRWPTMAAFADALDTFLRGDPAAAATAGLTLRIAGTPYAYRADPRQEVVTVGRQRRRPDSPPGEGNGFVLRVTGNDELSLRISRRHLKVHRTPAGYEVTDHSRAGTWLNGRPLPSGVAEPLAHGDRLTIAGVLTLKVLLDAPRAASTLSQVDLPAAGGPGRVILEATLGDMVTLE
jgi:serine/threonine protein kinase